MRHEFETKEEYDLAIAEYKKDNCNDDWLPADDLENYEMGTLFFNPNSFDDIKHNVLFVHKIKKGKPKIINFDNTEEWLKAIKEVKEKYNKSLLCCDSARQLRIGFLSVEDETIYRIGLSELKQSGIDNLNTPDRRKVMAELLA